MIKRLTTVAMKTMPEIKTIGEPTTVVIVNVTKFINFCVMWLFFT